LFGLLVLCAVPGPVRAAAPRLVVVVSVDQFAYRYTQWFDGRFPEDGLVRRVQKDGAWFSQCHHAHGFTYTAPGHAVMLTGTYPNRHGIIDNDWFDRARQQDVYCVEDPRVGLVGTTGADKPVSPRTLLVDTVGDQLKLATGGKAKVFGVAIKDRAAMLMTGHLADAAYWASEAGHWITSDYYRGDLPGYIRELNQQVTPQAYAGQTWDLLYPAEHYRHGVLEDSRHERPANGMQADFPHVMPAADDPNLVKHVACSPFGNDATLKVALRVIEAEKLGQDDIPDLLAINLSSNDYVGHSFGPDSLEVEDMLYRTDVQLSEFIDAVQRLLGGQPWVLYLTSDHGVGPIPERAAEAGLPARRDPLGDLTGLQQALEAYLRRTLRVEGREPNLILKLTDHQLYLDDRHPRLTGNNGYVAQQVARDWLAGHPAVAAAWTRQQLLTASSSSDAMASAASRGFHPQRSGDVLFALRPYHLQSSSGASHGSPWRYDTHIPLMVLGFALDGQATVPAGRFDDPVRPAQLAPTIARQLNIPEPAACDEQPLWRRNE
jgi:hypothetical protein